MNPILLSFLCGAAFIGGAVAVVMLVAGVVMMRDGAGRKELFGYWKESIALHQKQVDLMARIAVVLEQRDSD